MLASSQTLRYRIGPPYYLHSGNSIISGLSTSIASRVVLGLLDIIMVVDVSANRTLKAFVFSNQSNVAFVGAACQVPVIESVLLRVKIKTLH